MLFPTLKGDVNKESFKGLGLLLRNERVTL